MESFKQARLGKGTAWFAINSRIMKGLEWPTTATTMSWAQCNYVMVPVLREGLRTCGVNSKINRKIAWGSPKAMGLGARCLYTTQGINRILHCVENGGKTTSLEN